MDINKLKQKKIFQLTKRELKHLYYDLDLSQCKISEILNTDSSNVCRALKKHKIKSKTISNSLNKFYNKKNINLKHITKKLLIDLYVNNGKSINEISKEYKVSYSFIYNQLKKHNIKIKKNGTFQKEKAIKLNPKLKKINKSIIYELYWGKFYSLNEIGELYGVDKNYIKRRMIEFQIPIRTKKQAFNTSRNKKLRKDILKRNLNINLTTFKPNYNKRSIKIIEDFAKKNDYNFQHAENGGEYFIEEFCYWVDGYDKKNNVVVEYYETAHKYQIKYDKTRLNKIIKHLDCLFIIIHEDGRVEYHNTKKPSI
jgi:transposase